MTDSIGIHNATQSAGNTWYQVDHGYVCRMAYFRATKNAVAHNKIRSVSPKRWEILGIPIEGWKTGRYILLCLQSPATYSFFADTGWTTSVVEQIKAVTDRPIKIRKKGVGGIREDLAGAHAVVTYSSAAALDALLFGVPAFSVCAASKPIEDQWEMMDNPSRPERDPLFWSVAYGQFTQDEMRSGFARSVLESDNDIL